MGMFHVSMPKSKKRKVPKAQQAQHDAWLKSVNAMSTNFTIKKPSKVVSAMQLQKTPYIRQTPHYPSLDTGLGVATKSAPKIYTGDKVKGIATMHKSNAVPVFTDEQAVEISSMRR